MENTGMVCIKAYVNGREVSDTNVEKSVMYVSDSEPQYIWVNQEISLVNLVEILKENIEIGVEFEVKKLKYRVPKEIVNGTNVRYSSVYIKNDDSTNRMFRFYRRFIMYVEGIELIVVVEPVSSVLDMNQEYGLLDDVESDFVSVSQYNQDVIVGEGSSHGREERNNLLFDPEDRNACSEWREFANDIEYNSEEDDDYIEEEEEDNEEQNSDNDIMEEDDEGAGPSTSHNEVHYQPPPFMRYLDLDAMSAPEFPEYAIDVPEYALGGELDVGMVFKDKDSAEEAIKIYSINRSVNYRVKESIQDVTLYCVCVQFGVCCNWRIRVSHRKRKGVWEITKYNGPHTCRDDRVSDDHPKLDSRMIAKEIQDMVAENIGLKIKTIQTTIQKKFGFRPSYRKTHRAREKAIEVLFGKAETSYNELPSWLNAVAVLDPGSVFDIQSRPAYDGGIPIPNTRVFFLFFFFFLFLFFFILFSFINICL